VPNTHYGQEKRKSRYAIRGGEKGEEESEKVANEGRRSGDAQTKKAKTGIGFWHWDPMQRSQCKGVPMCMHVR